MAEQSPAAAAQGFETQIARIGREGLQLAKSLDELTPQEVTRLANLFHTGSDLTTRLGQTLLATPTGGGATVHSIRRMNDPRAGTFTRYWGQGTGWYRGVSGVGFTQLDAGLSGNPVSFLTVRPPLSGEPWMIMADSSKVRKANKTPGSPSLPVGLPIPGVPTLVVDPGLSKAIAAFDSGDGTQAANWTGIGGQAVSNTGPYTANPVLSDIPGTVGSAVDMATQVNPAIITTGYTSVMAIAKPLDLSTFTGGAATSDEDLIHLALRMDNPAGVLEVRLYFVVSPLTLPSVGAPTIPGTSTTQNLAAYVHTYRPSDYAAYIGQLQAAADAVALVRDTTLLQGYGVDISTENIPGANVWTEFGIVDLPVRRGDFLAVGSAGTAGTDWATVTGLYVVVVTTAAVTVNVALDDLYITGGYGPDSSEPGSQPYDYKVTNYDPRTGAESNGSTTMATTAFVDALRQSITVTPTGVPADANLRQGFYRRGGSLVGNWYFAGFNTANGAAFTDTTTDAALTAAGVVPVDHFQPVATVDNAGATVLAQPVPIMFGPLDDGTVCALGDPYRPGHLYASIAGQPDHWPSTGAYAVEVCAPAEELMNGCVVGGAGFVLSRERGYSVHTNLAGGPGITVQPTACVPGLAARWGFTYGPGGVYYVARDDLRVTNGNDSVVLSDPLWPLFHNQTAQGIAPIDFSHPEAIRLSVFDMDLWFLYRDTNGNRVCLIYSLVWRYWRPYTFARPVAVAYADETQDGQAAMGALQLLFGSTTGSAYVHSGFTDDGVAISWTLRTGAWNFGRPREEKLLGELVVEADLQGANLTAQTFLNTESVTNTAQTVAGSVGRTRYLFDFSGASPQHARSVSVNLSGVAPPTVQVALALAGLDFTIQPEVTMNRATTWQPLGTTEGYVYAAVLDCDTGGTARTILVEADLAGAVSTLATLTVLSNGRHKLWFSWPAAHAQLIRLRPLGDCDPWLLFNVEWLSQPEPPRIAGWDTNVETLGDSYYTGLDLEVDTFGLVKSVHCYVDQVELPGSPFAVTGAGRTFVHLTFTPGRGHLYRFTASDAHPGLLYSHKWITTPEPGEQTNWNAGYTVYNSLSDKYLKGIILEADTFGQPKTVQVQADGAVVATITPVTHTGRLVKNYTFPQVLGRVFRILPTDSHPSRLYTAQPIFDEEPFALARWESQLIDFDLPGAGWGSIYTADVCLKATAPVTLAIQVYNALGVLLQTITGVDPATGLSLISATGGAKQKRFVTFPANKGVLFKLLLTATDASPVTLYKEESRVRIQPWSGGQALVKPFGNDDLDPTREMTKAAIAAGRSGGGDR